MRSVDGTPPPADLYAERVTLGDMCCNPDHIPIVRGMLSPESFFDPCNRVLCRALYELDDIGGAIDMLTIASHMRDHGTWGEFGGIGSDPAARLYDIVMSTPAVSNVEAHAEVVLRNARRRGLIRMLHEVAAEAYHGSSQPLDVWMDSVSARIGRATRDGRRDGAATANETAKATQRWLVECASRRGRISGISTALSELDQLTAGLHGKEVTMVTAETGGGKSALVGQCCMIAAATPDDDGVNRNGVVVFSLEMPREDLMARWACNVGCVDSQRIRMNELTADDTERLTRAIIALSSLPIVIDDRGERERISFEAIRSELLRQKARMEGAGRRLALAAVDYVQLIDWRAEVGPRGSKYDGLDEIGKSFRRLAAEANVPILLPAQLNSNGQIRDCPPLAMHAHNWWNLKIEQDNGPQYGGADGYHAAPFSIHINKQRKGPRGVTAHCWFHGPYLRFADEQWIKRQ